MSELMGKIEDEAVLDRGYYNLVESHLEIGHNHHLAILLARAGDGAILITIPSPSCRDE